MSDQPTTDAQRLIGALLGPGEPELTCEQCFEQLDRYVDLQLAGTDADAAVPGMRAHLVGCPACLTRLADAQQDAAAALLLLAVAGTSALGLRYAESRTSDEFISLVIGVGVVVGLWALLIASTPQVVSLRGSILTVRNSSGSERFDLADGLQPVDVLGAPRSSQWALLLHRSNNTSVVLRRRDVDAVALDPIVRHYRAMADQRNSDRQIRFSR